MSEESQLTSHGNKLPPTRCPGCDYQMDAATAVQGGEHRPSAGDLSVCLNCGEMLYYGADFSLHKLSPSQVAALPSDTQTLLRRARRTIIERGVLDGGAS